MARGKPRERQVLFRMTKKEYNALKQMAILHTEGNISMLIRMALRKYRPKDF